MNYYTLLVMVDGRWCIEFGDYDKKVVEQEKFDSFSEDKTMIIKTSPNQHAINAKVAELNGE